MAMTHSALNRSGSEVLASQSRKGLTERLAHSPQVRLVFGEESPQLAGANGNFVNP
jgi:hypothetical protein